MNGYSTGSPSRRAKARNSSGPERLIAEEDHQVLQPDPPELGHDVVGEVGAEVDTAHFGAERAGERRDTDAGGHATCSSDRFRGRDAPVVARSVGRRAAGCGSPHRGHSEWRRAAWRPEVTVQIRPPAWAKILPPRRPRDHSGPPDPDIVSTSLDPGEPDDPPDRPHRTHARRALGARAVSPTDAVLVAEDGPVRIVTLNRPDTLNATDAELHAAITQVWSDLASDADARAIVLTGAGKAFSAGGDFGLLQTMVDDVDVRTATIDEGKTLVRSMLALEVPIVGAVNGPAVGLGCSLVSLCDLVLIADDAYLADPHVVLGLVAADGGAISWPFLTGLLRAKEHLLLGTRISAQQAVDAGLATRISAEPVAEALELAHRLAQLPPQSVVETKRLLNAGLRAAVETMIDDAMGAEWRSFDTPEFRENLTRLGPGRTRRGR
jgi:enoyl-CoA hydratase